MRNKIPKRLLIITLILGLTPSFCQNIRVYGVTPSIYQTTPFSKKIDWGLFLGTTYNPQDLNFSGLDYPAAYIRLQISNSIIYKPQKNIGLTLGFLYQRNFPFDDRHVNEYRPFQQITFSHFISGIKASHRLRFSERFIENTTTSRYPLTTMIQYLTSVQIPLKGKTIEEREFYFTGYLEEYVTLGGEKKYQTFSEFWVYGALGYNMGKYGKLQTGLVYEWVIRNKNLDTRKLYYLELLWMTNFDLFNIKEKS